MRESQIYIKYITYKKKNSEYGGCRLSTGGIYPPIGGC